MSSFRNYNDSRIYKPRTNVGTSNFGRNISSISSLGSKSYEKDRLRPTRSSIDDFRSKSPGVSGRASILEKYSSPGSNNSDINFSRLEKYSRASPRATSREPEIATCYGSSTYPGSSLRMNFGSGGRTEKKERSELPPVSYRSIRAGSGRTSREPSPDVSSPKINSLKMYSTRTPSYGRNSVSSNVSEHSSESALSRCGSSTGRYPLSSRSSLDRFPISYSDKFRTSSKSLSTPLKDESEVKNKAKAAGRQLHQVESDKNFRHVNQSSVNEADVKKKSDKSGTISLRVVSRGTSPTQPTSASLGSSRRPDSCKISEKEVSRIQKPLDTKDEEVQVDRSEDSRLSRFPGHARISGAPWASYLDRFNPSSSPTGSSSRNYTSVSRLSNYGYQRSSESPTTSSRSDVSVKTSSGSGREQKIPESSDNVRSKVKKTSDASNSNSSSNSNNNSNSNFLTPKSSERRKSKSLAENSQDAEYTTSRSEASCQMDLSSPKVSSACMKDETKSTVSSAKGDSSNGVSQSERRSSTSKTDCNSSGAYEENGIPRGQDKDLKKDFPQRSESVSSKSKLISRNNSSKNLARQMTRTDSSEGSVVSVPTGRLKSSSASSMTNHSAKIKTMSPSPPSPGKYSSSSATSVSSRQVNSSDTRGKPPVPKNEVAMKNTTGIKYVNKDFRKSVLNMENGDPARSQKSQKKSQRSMSTSSQDSEPNSEAVQGNTSSSKSNQSNIKGNNSRAENRKPDRKISPSRVDVNNRVRNLNSPSLKKNSNSEASCETSSTDSSSSEEGSEMHQQRSSTRRRRRATESPFPDGKNHMSTGSSRTSVLASSADELSLTMDKPPRPPPSPRSKHERNGRTEEAKCFLMRALAPVTSLFKGKQPDSGDTRADGWVHSNESNSDSTKRSGHNLVSQTSKSFNSVGSGKSLEKSKSNSRLRHQNSGERPWWLDPNSDNVPEGIERNSVGNDDISQETTVSTVLPDDDRSDQKICDSLDKKSVKKYGLPDDENLRGSKRCRMIPFLGSFIQIDPRNGIILQRFDPLRVSV